MEKNYPNKAISNEDLAEPKTKLVRYTFPHFGITVEAQDLEEAHEKLKQLIKK
jgi:hypothetical protein